MADCLNVLLTLSEVDVTAQVMELCRAGSEEDPVLSARYQAHRLGETPLHEKHLGLRLPHAD